MSRKASVIRISVAWAAALLLGILAAEDRLGIWVPHVFSLENRGMGRLWLEAVLMLLALVNALPLLVRNLTGARGWDILGGIRLPICGILIALLYSGWEMVKSVSEPARMALVQYEWAAFPLAVFVTLDCLGLGEEEAAKKTPEEEKRRKTALLIFGGILILLLVLWKFAGHKEPVFLVRILVGALISSVFIVWDRSAVLMQKLKRDGIRNGYRFRDDEAVRKVMETDLLILDKTGTVADGEPKVVTVVPLGKGSRQEVLYYACRAEHDSRSSFAKAIGDAYRNLLSEVSEVSELLSADEKRGAFTEEEGLGVKLTADDGEILCGNAAWFAKNGISAEVMPELLAQMNDGGQTVLFVAKNNEILGILGVSDRIDPQAKKALAEISAVGVTTQILTGDDKNLSAILEKRLGVSAVGPVSAEEKVTKVLEAEQAGHSVMMAGLAGRCEKALLAANAAFTVGEVSDLTERESEVTSENGNIVSVKQALVLARTTGKMLRVLQFAAIAFGVLGMLLSGGFIFLVRGMNVSPMQLSLAVFAFRMWEGIYTTKTKRI